MNLKEIQCPNCGGKLVYNSKTHSYHCNYCDSNYKDANEGAKESNEKNLSISLKPLQEVEKTRPISVSEDMKKSEKTVKRVVVASFIVVPILIISLIILVVLANQ